jgi:hypothetical protein
MIMIMDYDYDIILLLLLLLYYYYYYYYYYFTIIFIIIIIISIIIIHILTILINNCQMIFLFFRIVKNITLLPLFQKNTILSHFSLSWLSNFVNILLKNQLLSTTISISSEQNFTFSTNRLTSLF